MERVKRLELSPVTLARWRSTNCATPAPGKADRQIIEIRVDCNPVFQVFSSE